jgi:hypothetical protein
VAGTGLAPCASMDSCISPASPHYTIAKTERGWRLRIENEHFSVMQVFRSEDNARDAVDRMMEFFQTMDTQPPAFAEAPAGRPRAGEAA